MMLYRCNNYKKCKIEHDCDHYEPHKFYCFNCCEDEDDCICYEGELDTCLDEGPCTQTIADKIVKVKCIPVFDDFITEKDMEI